jgi:hypothetical protein
LLIRVGDERYYLLCLEAEDFSTVRVAASSDFPDDGRECLELTVVVRDGAGRGLGAAVPPKLCPDPGKAGRNVVVSLHEFGAMDSKTAH